ncbi:MAG: phosphatase PAP2 family protein [Cytophagales bacterium]|nr:phosphatase PAP2 family protein [Cytophagales bacterium]
MVLWFNERYTTIGNFLFKYLTHFGDGLFSIAVCIVFLFIRYYWSWIIFLSYGISSLTTQFLKKVVFSDMPRPKAYFGSDVPLNFVEGVEIYSYNSFPSGHTTSAFALACILSLLFPKKWATTLWVTLAILAALSRMYLAQHFVEDTLSGCLIGTITAAWVYYWQEKNSKWKSMTKSILHA